MHYGAADRADNSFHRGKYMGFDLGSDSAAAVAS